MTSDEYKNTLQYDEDLDNSPRVDDQATHKWLKFAMEEVNRIPGAGFVHRRSQHCMAVIRCEAESGYHDLLIDDELNVEINRIVEDKDSLIILDPINKMQEPIVYTADGPSEVVTTVTDRLGLDPVWERPACNEGEHEFECSSHRGLYSVVCATCEHSRKHLGYRGHDVPLGRPETKESHESIPVVYDRVPTESPNIVDKTEEDIQRA